MGLPHGPLDVKSAHACLHADASFATFDDRSSPHRFMTLLSEDNERCHLINYSSKKAKCIVRCIMAAKVCAFLEAFDTAYVVFKDLHAIHPARLPVNMFTYLNQLFDAVTKGPTNIQRTIGDRCTSHARELTSDPVI